MVSGNANHGILVGGSGAGTGGGVRIWGNLVRTDAAGSTALGNGHSGIYVYTVSGTIVGSQASGAGNVSANGDPASFNNAGVFLDKVTGTTIRRNRIGTDAAGAADLGNVWAGVFLFAAPRNTIGGAAAGAGNLVSAAQPATACSGTSSARTQPVPGRSATSSTG